MPRYPTEPSRRATLYDVATRAGVSAQTVSRVINKHPRVAGETRKKVLRAIEELAYQPNRAARSLKTQRSFLLQAIIFRPSYPTVAGAMSQQALEHGYDLVFSIAYVNGSNLDDLHAVFEAATSRMPDGILMIAPELDMPDEELSRLCNGIPYVQLATYQGAMTPSVVMHHKYGSQLATQHLISLGHRAFAEIAGPMAIPDARERHDGWLETLARHGLPAGPSLVGLDQYGSGFSYEAGYNAAHQLMNEGAQFTALVCGNDSLAVGAIKALRERGLRVPEQVSIVGFDDDNGAAFFDPPLTTVRQDFGILGRQAIDYLIELIEKPEVTPLQQRVLYPDLIVRASTAPAPG